MRWITRLPRVPRGLVEFAQEIAAVIVGGVVGGILGFLIGLGLDIPFPPPTRAQSLAAPLGILGWWFGMLTGGVWLQRWRDRSA